MKINVDGVTYDSLAEAFTAVQAEEAAGGVVRCRELRFTLQLGRMPVTLKLKTREQVEDVERILARHGL